MAYEITASRKRPQVFAELAGQEFVSATLEASLQSGRIAHAYLFSGPRGCGKTSAARILAKALNCETGPTARPCGACSSCASIAAGSSLDVIEIDGASNTSVDNVRQIKDEVLFPPNGGRYKVYIIDEVHMLSMSAFNALLKTIEEPPPYVVFIFATTELHKVPATIKSRCQQFAFRLIAIDTVKGLLAAAAAELGVVADDEALLWIAKESGGSLRDAYTLFDQVVSFSEGHIKAALIRDKLGLVGLDAMNALFDAAAGGQAPAALEVLDGILERGVSPEQVVVDAVEYARSLLLIKNGILRESLLGAAPSSFSAAALAAFSAERVERALGLLLDLHRDLRFTVDPRFELELAVSRLARLGEYVSPGELARAVAGIKRFLAGTAPLPQAAQAPGRGAEFRDRPPADYAEEGASAGPRDLEAEKKKPELPTSLRNAFSGLAAAALAEGQGAAEPRDMRPSREEFARQASPAPQAPTPPRASPLPEEAEDSVFADEPRPPAAGPEAEEPAERPTAGPSPTIAGPGQGAALKAATLELIKRSSPLLRSGLEASVAWTVEGERLLIEFANGMQENLVRGDIAAVGKAVAQAAGRSLRVELAVAKAAEAGRQRQPSVGVIPAEDHDGEPRDPVAVVERVFRGSRIT